MKYYGNEYFANFCHVLVFAHDPLYVSGIRHTLNRHLTATNLYRLLIEVRVCQQQGCYSKAEWLGVELTTFKSQVQHHNHYATNHATPLVVD